MGPLAMSPDGSVLAATVFSDGAAVVGLDPRDGTTLWSLPMTQAGTTCRGRGFSCLWSQPRVDRRPASGLRLRQPPLSRGRDDQVLHAVPVGSSGPGHVHAVCVGRRARQRRQRRLLGRIRGRTDHPRFPRHDTRDGGEYVAAGSPDGRRAVVVRETATTSAIALADTHEGGASGAVTVDGFLLDADFYPDGRRLAIATDDEDVLLLDGVTGEPGRDAEWSQRERPERGVGRAGPCRAVDRRARRHRCRVRRQRSRRCHPGPSRLRTFHRRVSPPATCRSGRTFSEVEENRQSSKYDGKSVALALTGLARCPCQVTSTELVPDGSLALGGYASWEPGMPPRTDIGQVVGLEHRHPTGRSHHPGAVTNHRHRSDTRRRERGRRHGRRMDAARPGILRSLRRVAGPGPGRRVRVTEATARARESRRTAVGWPSFRTTRSSSPIWRPAVNWCHARSTTPTTLMLSAAWTPDSSSLLVGSLTGRVHVLEAVSLEDSAPTRSVAGGFVIDVEIGEDGAVAATMGTDGDVLLWDAQS